MHRSYTHLEKESLKKLFCALVHPHLEYSVVVWSPKLEKDKKLIEGVLRRATKLIGELRDMQYEDRLKAIDIPSMAYRRARGDMIEGWKYLHLKFDVNNHFFVYTVVTAPTINTFKNRLDKVWVDYRYSTDLHFPLSANQVIVDEYEFLDDEEQLIGE
eukprot:gene18373-20223_t